jgi:hypothetical protein
MKTRLVGSCGYCRFGACGEPVLWRALMWLPPASDRADGLLTKWAVDARVLRVVFLCQRHGAAVRAPQIVARHAERGVSLVNLRRAEAHILTPETR